MIYLFIIFTSIIKVLMREGGGKREEEGEEGGGGWREGFKAVRELFPKIINGDSIILFAENDLVTIFFRI